MPRVRAARPYQTVYHEPIEFCAGERVQVGREDPEYPGWHWCRVASGREGWVHRSFLGATQGETQAITAYSARELDVSAGDCGEVLESLAGWIYLRLDDGRVGWLPQSHVLAEP